MGKEVIEAYLKEKDLNAIQLANMCKLSKGSVYNYLKGEPISKTCARKIENGTCGKIKAKDILSEPKK